MAPFPPVGGDANNDELACTSGTSGTLSLSPLPFLPLFLSFVVLDRPNEGKWRPNFEWRWAGSGGGSRRVRGCALGDSERLFFRDDARPEFMLIEVGEVGGEGRDMVDADAGGACTGVGTGTGSGAGIGDVGFVALEAVPNALDPNASNGGCFDPVPAPVVADPDNPNASSNETPLDGALESVWPLVCVLAAPNALSNENAPGTTGEAALCVVAVNTSAPVLIALGCSGAAVKGLDWSPPSFANVLAKSKLSSNAFSKLNPEALAGSSLFSEVLWKGVH